MPCCIAQQSVITDVNRIKVRKGKRKRKTALISTLSDAANRCGAPEHKIVLAEKIKNEKQKDNCKLSCGLENNQSYHQQQRSRAKSKNRTHYHTYLSQRLDSAH